MLRALPAPQSEDDKEPLVICGVSYLQKKVEPAGHAFHDVHEKPVIEGKRKNKKSEARDASDDEGADDSKWRSKHKSKDKEKDKKACGSLKLSANLEGVDLYKLFEVSEGATTEEIKKQYRKLALQHHPDKHQAEGASAPSEVKGLTEQDMLFVRIQEANEILTDQAKRRQYDSTLDFDDSYPEEVDEATGFYVTFQTVFHRNARWSTRRPVPDLGDDKTSIEKVHKFYDWWFEFDSWREFSQHAEHNLEDADCREERRWMERQNQKVLKKYEQDERKRIMHLAEVAERLDPRIRAEREEKEAKKREEKERRARLKQEEEDAKRREEEEKKQAEEREQAEREEKEKQEREQRKQKNQVLKSLRQRLKKSLQGRGKLNASEMEDLQELALGFEEPEPLEALCVRLEALKPAAALEAAVRKELDEWRLRNASEKEKEVRQREEARKNEERKAKEAKEAVLAAASGAAWIQEELGILAKGLQKFPGGMGGRWSLITQLLSASGYPRTEQEIVAKVKELSDGQSLRSMGSRLDSSFQAPNKVAKAKPEPKTTAAPKASPKAAIEKPAAEVEAPASSEWTAEQQKCLEAALQRHPATLDKNERWRLIAEEVTGKNKAQCVERFKFIREQMKK